MKAPAPPKNPQKIAHKASPTSVLASKADGFWPDICDAPGWGILDSDFDEIDDAGAHNARREWIDLGSGSRMKRRVGPSE